MKNLLAVIICIPFLIIGCAKDDREAKPTVETKLVSQNFTMETFKPDEEIKCKNPNSRILRVDISQNPDGSVKKIYIVCEELACK